MSTAQYDCISARRPSLANLYKNLQAQSDDPFDLLQDAACNFPEEDEVEEPYCAQSSSSSNSASPPFNHDDTDSDSESDSSSDSDSDVEPMYLSNDAYIQAYSSDSMYINDDAPFMPPRQPSPEITQPLKAPVPCAPLPRVATSPSSRSCPRNTRLRSVVAVASEDSDRDAESESIGDATDDEYVPSPRLNPKKRTRSSSPDYCRRSAASPVASLSSSTTSSQRPNKRVRMPPPSRNRQASSPAVIQRVANAAESADFTCPECGWRQLNERMPDFKRHLKTHLRPTEEEAEKGWRCKGVLVAEADHYGVSAGEPTYTFLDRVRVGGCMKTFSRRDALKRHLDNANVTCVGRPTAATEG